MYGSPRRSKRNTWLTNAASSGGARSRGAAPPPPSPGSWTITSAARPNTKPPTRRSRMRSRQPARESTGSSARLSSGRLGEMNRQRLGHAVRTLATGLWLPALFLAGVLFSYLLAFHDPAPHHVSIAVAAAPDATARLQHELDGAVPGGFTLRAAAGAAGARYAVLHLSAVAAYVPDGRHPVLYGAKADGAALETIIREIFAAAAGRSGGTLVFRELVPTVPRDAVGASPLYLGLACVVPAYLVGVTMHRAAGFRLRAPLAPLHRWGAAT